jgi:competence protein ComEA
MKHVHRVVAGVFLAIVLAAVPAFGAEAKAEPKAEGRKVNINSADASQLALLPRVGPSVAQRIVSYRKENGPFKKAEDLMLVPGIGEKTYGLLKPYLALSGETTLKEKVHVSRASSSKDGR